MSAAKASVAERAKAGEPTTDGQDGLFDVVIENELLEAALERRQRAKEKAAKPKKDEKEAVDAVKGMVAGIPEVTGFDIETDDPLAIRCGRFRIKVAARKGSKVSFETEPRTHTTISLLGEE